MDLVRDILIILLVIMFTSILYNCGGKLNCNKDRKYFTDMIYTTSDGFVYYYNEEKDEGAALFDFPNYENVIIPEYVDEHKVTQIGHIEYDIGSGDCHINYKSVTNLTIQHDIKIGKNLSDEDIIKFSSLETLTFIDFLYCNLSSIEEELLVPHYIGRKNPNLPNVKLKKSDREYSLEEFQPKVILIPEYVTEIEKGVFDGLTDVVIKTSYESIPDGWEEGWNGECEVIWGEDIEYLNFVDCFQITEDDFSYYYNPLTDEGVYIYDIPLYDKSIDGSEEVVIPEYIYGKKVLELGYRYQPPGYLSPNSLYRSRIEKLTIQHEFSIFPINGGTYGGQCVCFLGLKNLIFIDFLYCNLTKETAELIVPAYIGLDPKKISNDSRHQIEGYPDVILKKSDREYSLEEFKPKVIIIPEYVTIIEKGVFDGLEDVVIKTSYESIPEGWEEGWNGNCEVIWGVDLELE